MNARSTEELNFPNHSFLIENYLVDETDGAIWKGDLSTGEGEVVLTGAGGSAIGLDYDRRSGFLYVCGGLAGAAWLRDRHKRTCIRLLCTILRLDDVYRTFLCTVRTREELATMATRRHVQKRLETVCTCVNAG